MEYSKREVQGVTIIDLVGKITIGEGDTTLRDIVTEIMEKDKKKIIFNLGKIKYMDSAGIGELIRSYTTVKNSGGDLKLLNLTKKIKDLLTITKLITIFNDFTNEDEAVQSFQ